MKKNLEKMLIGLEVILLGWFGLSYLEIVCKNLGSADYSWWNLFEIFFN